MATKDVLTVWLTCDEEDYGDFYRDTLGGRQTLKFTDESTWELSQEGYYGVLHASPTQAIVVKYADEMSGVESLRIANMDAYDFAKAASFQVVSIIKHLCSSEADQAEDGLKEVAQLEAMLLILRHRLAQRTGGESMASRSEAVAAQALKIVNLFYAEMIFGELDRAAERAEEMRGLADEMSSEVREALGDPSNLA